MSIFGFVWKKSDIRRSRFAWGTATPSCVLVEGWNVTLFRFFWRRFVLLSTPQSVLIWWGSTPQSVSRRWSAGISIGSFAGFLPAGGVLALRLHDVFTLGWQGIITLSRLGNFLRSWSDLNLFLHIWLETSFTFSFTGVKSIGFKCGLVWIKYAMTWFEVVSFLRFVK